MLDRRPPRWAWPLAGLLLAVAGSVLLLREADAVRRDAFYTDARIAHRLLSQQAVQHDAMLATLALLQPGPAAGEAASPEQRLPSLVPQVLQVLRRARGDDWPPALARADAASAAAGRAVLAEVDFTRGQYTLVRAGQPASYALRIDASRMVPWAEWPLPRDSVVRVALRQGAQRWLLQPGAAVQGPWQLHFDKPLAAESQPFTVELERSVTLAELPWARLLLCWLLSAAVVAALAAWQRQREAARRAEELLRLGQVGRLNAMGELAAGMAHELNQPLTAVLANTQAAQRLLAEMADPGGDSGDGGDLATARQALAQAAQQARRAGDVVARLRRLVQPGDPGAAPQPVPLAAAVLGVLYLLRPQLDAAGVQLDTAGLDPVLVVRADPVALEQIVHNLALNALQALQAVPAGRRRLQLRTALPAAGRVQLQVQDSGPGFAPAALARAFEPFFTTRDGGLGLGLSLCESLATGLGGTLAVANADADRGGALLTLDLPAASPP